jgi:hypothetical protein
MISPPAEQRVFLWKGGEKIMPVAKKKRTVAKKKTTKKVAKKKTTKKK